MGVADAKHWFESRWGAVEVTHHGEERGSQGEQRAREGQGADPREEGLGTAGGNAVPVLAEQRPDQGDVAGARSDEGIADEQPPAHVTLSVRETMRPTVGAEDAGLGQGARVPAIGLHLARARGVHGAKFGSATTTSCPNASRHRATDSLPVEASITIRACGRPPSTAAKRSGSVRIQLAESYLTATVFRQILGRIERLAWHPTRSRAPRSEGDDE